MKTAKILMIVALMAFMAASCSEDDKAAVAGSEYETTYVKAQMSIKTESVTMDTTMVYDTKEELVEADMYMVIKFDENGDFFADGEKDGTWTLDGSALKITSEDEVTSAVVSGDKITVEETEVEDGVTMKIKMVFSKK